MNIRLKQLYNLFVKSLFYVSHLLDINSFHRKDFCRDFTQYLKPHHIHQFFYSPTPNARCGAPSIVQRNRIKHSRSKFLGFSLVEFMIAISISTFIILGLLSVYSSGKQTYVVQEGLGRLQENGRFTTHYMNKTIRMAGYQGCVSSQNMDINNIVSNPSAVVDFNNAVFGYNGSGGTWSPNLPAHLTDLNIKPNTDVIEIWEADDRNIRLSLDMANPNAAIVLADPDGDGDHREGIDQDDIFVITDCEIGDMAAAAGTANATSIAVSSARNTTVTLSKAYTTNARIFKLKYTAFYIKDTGRTNVNGAIIYALVARDVDGNELELADGVEDLKVSYGIDTDGDGTADTYLGADSVDATDDWANVLTVRTAKLLNTIEDVSPIPQAYTFEGVNTTPTDRQLRREWTNIISIRNRNFP